MLLSAMCSIFYPPLSSSNVVLCRETCNRIFTDCQVAPAFFTDFTVDSCQDFPLSEDSGELICIGDLIGSTVGQSTSPTTFFPTTKTTKMETSVTMSPGLTTGSTPSDESSTALEQSSPATTFGATTPPTSSETSAPTSPGVTTKLTTSVTATPSEPVPVVGICEDFLPYQFSEAEPVGDLVISLSPDAITATILNSGLCDDSLLPAMCSLFFPPLVSSDFVLCQDTCSDIFVNCRAAVAFFTDIMEDFCLDAPLRSEGEGASCIGDEGSTTLAQTSSPSTFDTTRPTTNRETSAPTSPGVTTHLTPSVTSTPSEPVTVVGICEEFLPYQLAQPEPVLELVIDLSLDAITATILNSGLCDSSLLPGMCSLFFPPLTSSDFVLCQETCSDLFSNCRAAVAFFADITESFCLDKPIRAVVNVAGDVCIGDEVRTTERIPSTSTDFGTSLPPATTSATSPAMSSSLTTELTPSESSSPTRPIAVFGVCQEYLDYGLAGSEPLFDLVTAIPLDAATASIAGYGLCEDVLPAVCSLFFPPLPSSDRVLCQDSCREIVTECPVATVFFPDLSLQSCSRFPRRSATGDNVCVGDRVPTTRVPEETSDPTSPIIIVDYLCDLFGCENGGTCADNDRGGRSCVCPPGFSGELCEEYPCDRLGCQNGGFCFPNNMGDKVCFCPAEFAGEFCELSLTPGPTTPELPTTSPEIDFPCEIYGCENGGFCFPNKYDIKVCFCPGDFSGEFCEISLTSSPSPSQQPSTVPTEPSPLTTIAPCTPDELESVEGLCQQVLPYGEALLEPNYPLVRDDFSVENIISLITSNSLCSNNLIAGMCYLFYPPCPNSGLFLCPETCRAIFRQVNGCSAITTFLEISEEACSSFPEGQEVGNGLCVERGPTTLAPATTERVTTPQTTSGRTTVATTISTTPVQTTEATSSPLPMDTTQPTRTSSPTFFTPGDTTTAAECYDVPLFCRDVITYEMTSVLPDQNRLNMYRQFEIIFACHVDMKLYACAHLYPPCEPLLSRSLCMERCSEVEDSCGNTNLFGKLEFNCNQFTDAAQAQDGLCRAGFLASTSEAPTTTPGLTTTGEPLMSSEKVTPVNIMCVPVNSRCSQELPYSMGVLTMRESVVENFLDIHFGLPSSCNEKYRELICATVYQPCPETGFGVGFCSDVCEEIERTCELFFQFFPTLSFPVDCDTLPSNSFDEELYDEYGLCN